jgi:hypothetical protein
MKLYSEEFMKTEEKYRPKIEDFEKLLQSVMIAKIKENISEAEYTKFVSDQRRRFEAAIKFPAFHWHPVLDSVTKILREMITDPPLEGTEVMMSSILGLSAGHFRFRRLNTIGVSLTLLKGLDDGNILLVEILRRRSFFRVFRAHWALSRLKKRINTLSGTASHFKYDSFDPEVSLVSAVLTNFQILFVALHEVGHLLAEAPPSEEVHEGRFIAASEFGGTNRQLAAEKAADDFAIRRMIQLIDNPTPLFEELFPNITDKYRTTCQHALALLFVLLGALSPRTVFEAHTHPHPVERFKSCAKELQISEKDQEATIYLIRLAIRTSG